MYEDATTRPVSYTHLKEDLYLKSSHSKAFSLYQRLGEEIGSYQTLSDNGEFKRTGKIFKIKVNQ